MLAVMAGIFVMSVLGFMFLCGIIGALGSSETPVLPKSGVLKIDMSTTAFCEQSAPMDPMSLISGGGMTQAVPILDALNAIQAAAEDPAIRLIYLNASSIASVGMAQLEELRTALSDFRKSGKAVISFVENPSSGAYYLASVADKVYMSFYCGSAQMSMSGVSSQMYFLGDLLAKLGVNVQLIRHGKYKSAGEMYIRNSPSEANYEQARVMVSSIWDSMVDGIALSRGIEPEKFKSLVDDLALCEPQDFLDNGLVDGLVDSREFNEQLGVFARDEAFANGKGVTVPFPEYVKSRKPLPAAKAKTKIALVYADGEIVDGFGSSDVAGDRFSRMIAKVEADSTVKAVVLRVNSPGGSVLAADKIKVAMDRLAKVKPVVASYGGYAASGGYWISSACERIFTDRSTLTGSIGVFSMIPDASGLLKNILHVGVATVSSSAHGDMYGLSRPLDAAERDYMQKGVENIYSRFVNIVSEGRNMLPERVDSLAQGRVWTGADAVGLGLADEIGGLKDAIAHAAGLIGESGYSLVSYPAPKSDLDLLLGLLGSSTEDNALTGTPLEAVGRVFSGWNESSGKAYARLDQEYVFSY